jgi:hypothetical protein
VPEEGAETKPGSLPFLSTNSRVENSGRSRRLSLQNREVERGNFLTALWKDICVGPSALLFSVSYREACTEEELQDLRSSPSTLAKY